MFEFIILPSLYGKSIENTLGRLRSVFVRTEMKLNWYKNKPQYRGHIILGKSLAVVFLIQTAAKLKKPLYVGTTILEVIAIYYLFFIKIYVFISDFFHYYYSMPSIKWWSNFMNS